jgi:hypothetical protein
MPVQRRMSSLRITALLLIGASALASAACLHPTGCDAVLVRSYHPVDTTIRVGQGFRPDVNLSTCGGTKPLTDALRYSADDTTILRVDSLSGTMTGRAAGRTIATVIGLRYGTVARIGITVQ